MQDLTQAEMDALARVLGTPLTSEGKTSSGRQTQNTASRVQLTQIEESSEPIREDFKENLEEVELHVEAILGKAKISLGKLMEMKEGEIITLDTLAGELLDIEANRRRIARGEAVIVDGFLGIRLLEIIHS